jgi:competence protein ComEC
VIGACFLCLGAGILRYPAQPLTPCWSSADLAYYNLPADQAYDRAAREVTVTGYVSSYPLQQDTKQQFEVTVTTIRQTEQAQPVQGQLRLTTDTRTTYHYGQSLQLEGRLVTPPDFTDFSYREYLARKGIHSLFYPTTIALTTEPNQGTPLFHGLYALRARGESLLNRLLPEPYAALANGMLLGIESGIPDTLYEQFNLTGSSHVIVISGSNVALIAGVMLAFGRRTLGQRRAIWPALAGIAGYALLVGGDAAVLRAAWMGALYAIATTLDRRNTALVSLAFACWVMTIANPLTLWDVGFQLSSAATAGLILFSPGVVAFFSRLLPGWLAGGPLTGNLVVGGVDLARTGQGILQGLLQDGLMVTIAANISTLPLVLYYFGRLSVVSLLTNVLIAPAQPFIMLWGSAGILLGVLGLAPLAQLVLWLPWLCLVWTVSIVQWTAALPGASLAIAGYTLTQLGLTYGVIALVATRQRLGCAIATWWDKLRAGKPTWQLGATATSSLAIGVLTVSAVLIWAMLIGQPDGRLHLYFLNIGQGDGILIQTPSGRQLLIDGGASPQQLAAELGAVMPFWDRTIDMALMTHPDSDHVKAQSTLPARFAINTAVESAVSGDNPDADEWRTRMQAGGATILQQGQGGWLDLGDGVALWLLWPAATPYTGDDADNENSIVAKLVYGDFSLLLTGDAGLPSEAAMLAAALPLQSTVLKVGHHGSKNSSGPAFLAAVQPQIAVIQVGAENRYGHPAPEILDRLSNMMILRNDQHGRIHIYTDGQNMWIATKNVAL